MTTPHSSRALVQFVEDEMLRAPLLFDQLIDATVERARQSLPSLEPFQRQAAADLMQALKSLHHRMADYFVHSLREQTAAEIARQAAPQSLPAGPVADMKTQDLALVDEQEVALDVQLSHTIEAIKNVAEFELRELRTFVASLVGDLEMSRDHNPFRAETFARALWAASQALPSARGQQLNFMRHASTPLAQLLRTAYAAASSRLESQGIEPAAYRTLILPNGSRTRHGRMGESSVPPDMRSIRDAMPDDINAEPRGGNRLARQAALGGAGAGQHTDRQAVELVKRLFEAVLADTRVKPDVALLVARLQTPAMRLALRDPGLFDHDRHPLWRYVNRLVYASEMTPDFGDPERLMLLKQAKATIDQLASEAEQTVQLYGWSLERLETYLHKRLTRRLTGVASQLGALHKLEEQMVSGRAGPATMNGALDIPHLDTVPADLMDPPPQQTLSTAERWIAQLQVGDWVRMFLQGRWVHAQLLWAGTKREILFFGDGASDATWVVRRSALLMMHGNKLLKDLKQRAIVASAARRVQEQLQQGGGAG
ncbi:conserved hypothetical protein [Rubrivivax sp. A210]|uniref:DUF1631 family protein n=1 Tax=Rubrivivax sp. A210 TaxID=2772301 RepID=UPI001917C32E|nr:DUF1631 family protein [Rubrivivax sp. A210]CAD5374136.1 conserved hypothetical protein [Rubrivivax sp. A210]